MTIKKQLLIGMFVLLVNIFITILSLEENTNINIVLGTIVGSVFIFPMLIMLLASIWKEYRTSQVMVGIFYYLTIFIFIAKLIGVITQR